MSVHCNDLDDQDVKFANYHHLDFNNRLLNIQIIIKININSLFHTNNIANKQKILSEQTHTRLTSELCTIYYYLSSESID